MKRRPQQNQQKGSPKWMVTFSDMMTLILVFFIMLFSMSVVDAQKFKELAESFQQSSILENSISSVPVDTTSGESIVDLDLPIHEEDQEMDLDELLIEVITFLEKNGLSNVISAIRDERGVVLVLQERILFDSGEAEILPSAVPFLSRIGLLLESMPNIVRVEGHTDSRPISTYRYPSNWELSGARASSVIRFFIDNYQLESNRFIATGYGDTRPTVDNTTTENLQKNRRVVIVITDPSYEREYTY